MPGRVIAPLTLATLPTLHKPINRDMNMPPPTTTPQDLPAPTADRATLTAGHHIQHASSGSPSVEVITQHNDTHIELDFETIADWCALDKPTNYNIAPHDLYLHRQACWPDMNEQVTESIRCIYQAVKQTGLPNCLGARLPLQTDINVTAWRSRSDGSQDEKELMDFIEFGFPLAYNGPAAPSLEHINHSSATQFPDHIQRFIEEEIQHGAMIGPFTDPMFVQWSHTSPMMTRPKSDPTKRRIITDLSYPPHNSINAYIKKNCSMGRNQDHSLPTVHAVVEEVKRHGEGVTLFTMDVHRAYKNFRACPLDWPLLNICWPNQEGQMTHALDMAMPFGSKLSSLYFQRIAKFITRVLSQKGIKAFMYLDDLIVIAPDPITAYYQFDVVRELFRDLGLPEAPGKTQPPSHKVTFLGIDINTRTMTLSITPTKVEQTLTEIKKLRRRSSITRKQLQSIVGRIIHVAKCVAPARLFACRLLDTLRGPIQTNYQVDRAVRADLDWFVNYLKDWNGVAYIPSPRVAATIYTDACMGGVGATDGNRAYAARLSHQTKADYHITEIEGFNVLLACDAFLDSTHTASTVVVRCDNKPAVQVFATGRGRNPVLLDTARKLWHIQAKLHLNIVFIHIPGEQNAHADILSRAFLSPSHYDTACSLIAENNYIMCQPRDEVVNDISPA